MKRFLREPLVHFLAIGAALFLLFAWRGGAGGGSARIVITSGRVDHLAAGFAKVWQRPPTEAELKGLVDDWVREEIAVREATAQGLDRDDSVVRRRLRQKLEFLTEEAADAAPPSDAELAAYLAAHRDAFAVEPKVAFRQVFLSRERRGARAEADARALLARLAAAGPSARADALGDPTLLPREVELSPRRDVARTFGSEFAAALDGVPAGAWSGPLASPFGLHLVLVTERAAGGAPALADVRPAVERELLAERRKKRLDATYEKLLARYRVVVERREPAAAAKAKP